MNLASRIIRNSFFLTLTTISDRLAELVLFFLMARSLGPSFVGDYKTIVVYLTIFQNLGHYGLTQLVMRRVATTADRQEISALLMNYGFAGLAIGLGLLVIMNASATLIAYPPHITLGIYLVSLALLPSVWRRVAEAVISGMESMQYISLVSLAGAAFRVALTVLLLWRGGGITAILVVLVITQWVTIPAYLYVINRFLAPVRFRPQLAYVTEMAREVGTFLLMGVLLVGVGTQLDIVMIRKLTDAEQAGLYTAASTLVQTVFLIRPALLNSVFPNMASLFATAPDRFRALTIELLRLLTIVLLPLPFAALLLAKPLMPLLLGESFAESARVLQIQSWIILPSFAYATLSRVLVACNQERRNIQIAAVGMVANVALNLILIPWYGAAGASLASVASMLLATAITVVLVHRRVLTLPFGEVLGKPLLCTLAACAVACPLRNLTLWLLLPLLAAVYGFALLATRAIPPAALALARQFARRLAGGRGAAASEAAPPERP